MIRKIIRRSTIASVVVLVISFSITIPVIKDTKAQVSEQADEELSEAVLCTDRANANSVKVILPPSYDVSETYPALFLMPYTTGTPTVFFNSYFSRSHEVDNSEPYIVILPLADIAGAREDIANPDALARYENAVKAALSALVSVCNIDPSRLAIAGWSLGGDLAWHITLRNPDLFQGAMIVGSRSINPNPSRNPELIQQLATNNVRLFMAMGDRDIRRLPDMRSSVDALAQYSVSHRFEVIPTTKEHGDAFDAYAQNETEDLAQQGVEYILFHEQD